MVTWLRWWRIQTAAHLMVAVVLTVSAITAWALGNAAWLQVAGVAANVGFWWLARREYRKEQEREAWRRFRESPAFRDFDAAMRRMQETVGRSIEGPFSKMAKLLADGQRTAAEHERRRAIAEGDAQR